jgi:hypothetical protein
MVSLTKVLWLLYTIATLTWGTDLEETVNNPDHKGQGSRPALPIDERGQVIIYRRLLICGR